MIKSVTDELPLEKIKIDNIEYFRVSDIDELLTLLAQPKVIQLIVKKIMFGKMNEININELIETAKNGK